MSSSIACIWPCQDDAAFRADTARGLAMGYEGRLCIHPRQVELGNAIYTPPAEQLDCARRIVEGWEAASRAGTGVFTVDGKMIDAPLVAQQRRILVRGVGPGRPAPRRI